MPSTTRRFQVLVAVALSTVATLATVASALAGNAPGPWPR
jgi:hypothetical protein